MLRNLKSLEKRGLVNAGLVELTPTMLERYNGCLERLGIAPTAKKKVLIDGIGWSPQIAQERKNPYYLCCGSIINPVAIIVSPDQYKMPVYWPVFSWIRGAVRLVFEKYHREIIDITATHTVTLDCENGLSSLKGPGDLLLLSEITLQPNTESIAEAAHAQRELVARFSHELNCLEENVRSGLVAHRREHGDLRKRRLDMQPVTFDYFHDFYTAAFGGAAVFRDVGGSDMLVLESQNEYESIKGSPTNAVVCHLFDAEGLVTGLLAQAGMLRIPLEEYRLNPQLLEDKKELLLSLALCDCEEGVDWNQCSSARRKSLVKKHEDKVPTLYAELERFAAAVRGNRSLPDLSVELWHYLAVPTDRLPPTTIDVLWILLTKLEPRRVMNMYRYDKNHFLERFGEWSSAKQEWVADYIKARYQPRMLQK